MKPKLKTTAKLALFLLLTPIGLGVSAWIYFAVVVATKSPAVRNICDQFHAGEKFEAEKFISLAKGANVTTFGFSLTQEYTTGTPPGDPRFADLKNKIDVLGFEGNAYAVNAVLPPRLVCNVSFNKGKVVRSMFHIGGN